MLPLWEYVLGVHLLTRGLDPWRDHAFDSISCKLELLNELLGLPWVSLILEAPRRPPNHSVQYGGLLVILVAGAQAPSDRQLVFLPHDLLEPVELFFWSCGGEVVAVH